MTLKRPFWQILAVLVAGGAVVVPLVPVVPLPVVVLPLPVVVVVSSASSPPQAARTMTSPSSTASARYFMSRPFPVRRGATRQ